SANCLDLAGPFEPDAGLVAANRAVLLSRCDSRCDNEIGTIEPGGAHVASSAAMTIMPAVAANDVVAMLARDHLRAISTPHHAREIFQQPSLAICRRAVNPDGHATALATTLINLLLAETTRRGIHQWPSQLTLPLTLS